MIVYMKNCLVFATFFTTLPYLCWFYNFHHEWDPFHSKYIHFSEKERLEMVQASKEMFQFGYDNYMKHAFPEDELDPIHCRGRGADHAHPENININDVLGDYTLTLVESLDTLAIMGNSSEFKEAVRRTIEHVSFDKNTTVQVFEATIRVLGSLLSAHLIIKDSKQPFGNMSIPNYDNELLDLAHDLANRLLPAFSNTPTGIPFPRISLNQGVPFNCVNETCTSGAGTLVLEFGILSHLLNDPVYEGVARRAVTNLWKLRSNVTGLLGNVINIQTGEWVGRMSGLGAGIDSFFEYLLKAYILFGDENDLRMFNESYEAIKFHLRRGRESCNSGSGKTPLYVNVNMRTGDVVNTWIDALQAAWSAVQVLNGDIEEAICSHAVYYTIWRRYSALPERYNWQLKAPDVKFYPLRPELVESTYFLYRATKNPFYLHVGRDILKSIDEHTKETCGYCTIHDVHTKELEDRMESFFLSETCKYLYLLFDVDNPVNKDFSRYLFSTEGHIFPIDSIWRSRKWEDEILGGRRETNQMNDASSQANGMDMEDEDNVDDDDDDVVVEDVEEEIIAEPEELEQEDDADADAVHAPTVVVNDVRRNNNSMCDLFHPERRYNLPLLSHYLTQIEVAIGLRNDGDF